MKKSIIKNSILAISAMAGLQTVTSCNSCSRKDTVHNDDEPLAIHDTVYIDTCMATNDSLLYEKTTGNYIRVNRVSTAATATPKGSTAATGGKKPSGGTRLTEEEIENRIENSSSTAYKNGKPVNSGGTSGTGQGTGTGSTGNNSRVTTKEDQLGN
jgi:hypothetical protein